MSDIAASITSNASGQISGLMLRTILNDMVDSMGVQLSANTWNDQNIFNGAVSLPIPSSIVTYTSLGTGAKAWNVEGALQAQWLFADGFTGVDPTGLTDSTVGVQAALNAAAPGSKVYFGGKYYVGNLTVPDHVTIECGLSYPDPLITAGVGTLQNPYDWKGQLKQKTGTTITTNAGANGGRIHNCLLIREGLSLPVTTAAQATTLLTQMSGTGVTLHSASFEFDHVAMFGHSVPIDSDNPAGAALSNRVKIFNSVFDNLSGPKIAGIGDPATVENNQIFPFLTISVPDIGPTGTTPAIMERPGVGLWTTAGPNNASQINGNLLFGYQVCMQLIGVVENHIFRNHCEYPPTLTPTAIGFVVTGAFNKLVGNLAIGYTYPFQIENGGYPDGQSLAVLDGNSVVCPAVSSFAFRFVSGSFDLTNSHTLNCPSAIGIDAGVVRGHIGYAEYDNVTTKLTNSSTGPIIVDGFQTTPTVTGATYAVLASDTSITANGSATLTVTLPTAANYPGRRLTVKTIAAFAVVSASANVEPLAGGAPGTAIVPATAGRWVVLESTGANWKIVGAGADLDGPLTWGAQQTFSVAPIFTTLTGYLKGNGAAALTAAATVPSADFADGNTGTGAVAHATSPSFTTPTLGAADATSVKIAGVAIASLGTCDGAARGTLKWVDDTVASAAPTFHATVAGGGATTVHSLVSCDGINWVWN